MAKASACKAELSGFDSHTELNMAGCPSGNGLGLQISSRRFDSESGLTEFNMPIKWYYPTGSSGPIPCEWVVQLPTGEWITVVLMGM